MLFCAKDVASALGYVNGSKAVRDHCRMGHGGPKRYPIADRLGRLQTATFIDEGDVYRLIASSRLDSAQEFESWVFDDVLPTIRRHGVYATPQTVEAMLADPDTMIRTLQALKEEREARIEAETARDRLVHAAKTYTTTEIAKELGMRSAQQLNKELERRRVQYKQNGTWVLYSDYSSKGYTSIKQDVLDSGRIVYDRRWTGRGRDFLIDLLGEKGYNSR